MAQGLIGHIDVLKLETEIDWHRMSPFVDFGAKMKPQEVVDAIKKDVGKLQSVSAAGKAAIIEERCAKAGVSPDGVPTFYVGRTRVR